MIKNVIRNYGKVTGKGFCIRTLEARYHFEGESVGCIEIPRHQ